VLFLNLNKVTAQTTDPLDTTTLVNGWRLVEYAPGVYYAKTHFDGTSAYHGKFSQWFEVRRFSPDVVDANKYYAIFKKNLKKPIKVASTVPQVWTNYSHTEPGMSGYNEVINFSIAFEYKGVKTSFSNIGDPGDGWRQTTPSPVLLDSIDCVYIKVSGNFLRTFVQIDYIAFVEYATGPVLEVIEDFEDSTIVGVKDEPIIPTQFSLSQNYPNPFNPSTMIHFQISNFKFVTLKVYDSLGREIVTLVNEEKSAGEYTVKFNGLNLSSGTYFCRIDIGHGQFVQTKKMILVK